MSIRRLLIVVAPVLSAVVAVLVTLAVTNPAPAQLKRYSFYQGKGYTTLTIRSDSNGVEVLDRGWTQDDSLTAVYPKGWQGRLTTNMQVMNGLWTRNGQTWNYVSNESWDCLKKQGYSWLFAYGGAADMPPMWVRPTDLASCGGATSYN